MPGLRLLVPSLGGDFTRSAVKGGGNMTAYIFVKNDGRTLVTTVINANEADSVGGNPVTLTMPDGFSVDSASQVYGPSNDVKNATQVAPTNPLPGEVPFSGAGRRDLLVRVRPLPRPTGRGIVRCGSTWLGAR